jgi:hypothetical protein
MLKRFWLALINFLGLNTVVISGNIGMQPDKSALWGLAQAIWALDIYVKSRDTVTTAGTNSTLTNAQALAGALILSAGATGGFTITLPTTASLLGFLRVSQGLIPTDGSFSKIIEIKNSAVGQTGTLTAGDANTTITGTATIATNTVRRFLMTITSATTITFENFGSSAL